MKCSLCGIEMVDKAPDDINLPDNLNCGGDCWKCMREIEKDWLNLGLETLRNIDTEEID